MAWLAGEVLFATAATGFGSLSPAWSSASGHQGLKSAVE